MSNRVAWMTADDLARELRMSRDRIAELARRAPACYFSFPLPKPDGGSRMINAPSPALRKVQRAILDALADALPRPAWMTGAMRGRSTIDHATPHMRRDLVLTIDIKAFFPSVSTSMVRSWLCRLGIGAAAQDLLLPLVLHEESVPQGAPTSPTIANHVLAGADCRIDRFCRRHGLHFTRYLDDIAISGTFQAGSVLAMVRAAIQEAGFELNDKKIRVMPKEARQVVTGLVVNNNLHPEPEYLSEIEQAILLALDEGGDALACIHGLNPLAMRDRLRGQIDHVARFNRLWSGKQLDRLRGVRWDAGDLAGSKIGTHARAPLRA